MPYNPLRFGSLKIFEEEKNMPSFNFLVVGGGIAGLSFALKAAETGTVAVLFKRNKELSSTSWAQGGIAAVAGQDDLASLHIKDTLTTGEGLSDPKIVELVVTEGPKRVAELIKLGVQFDKEANSENFHLHQEGGHSRRRIFHAADATGSAIQKSLLKEAQANSQITFFENADAIDLITTHKIGQGLRAPNRVIGCYVLREDNSIETFAAEKILLATGGAGKVYLYTSNPDVATGDGIAMAYRAGCRIANMEFFQFHPTCLFHPVAKSFLITEAMRGEGAKLLRIDGTPFMERYHPSAELAPRDVVARAIDHELKISGDEYVLLDITHRPPEFVREHFPTIYEKCLSLGIDITTQPIPVVPAAHYCCGGVVVDENGKTDIENLHAAGECAHTGLHGANRLASNSLLEGVVFGYRAGVESASTRTSTPNNFEIPEWDDSGTVLSEEQVIISQNWDEIRRFMWNYVGIVRSDKRLERALRRSKMIEHEIHDYYWNFQVTADLLELRNLNLVAQLVIKSAMKRKESRGLHYTIDHPNKDPQFAADTVIFPGEAETDSLS